MFPKAALLATDKGFDAATALHWPVPEVGLRSSRRIQLEASVIEKKNSPEAALGQSSQASSPDHDSP